MLNMRKYPEFKNKKKNVCMHEYIQTSMDEWEGWVRERLGSKGKGADHQTR